MKKKVLLVDIDPQGNTTSGLGINKADVEECVYDVLMNEKNPAEVIISTSFERLWLLPATIQLAGAEIELSQDISRKLKLKWAIQQVKDQFDYISIDCPP